MALQHPYCRTCGSHIRSKEVCNYCGCDPSQGQNYCCDCGTSTVAEAIMCVHCGASFQRKFPVALAVLISLGLAAGVACAGYFITRPGNETTEKTTDYKKTVNTADSNYTDRSAPRKKDEPVKIINNIPEKLLTPENSPILKLTKNLPKNPRPENEKLKKPVTPEKTKPEVTVLPEERPATTGRVSMDVFSSREMRSYSPACTYFQGRSKNNIVFFTTNVYGYVKINGKVYALQGVQKGNDIARFAGAGYEVTVEILGLAGSEKEWLSEATLVIRDVSQRTLSKHKIYSTCTDF